MTIFSVGILLERAAERQPRHRQRRFVGPAEVRVDQVLRRRLAVVVGRRVGAPRVEQDRQVVGRHLLVERKDLRRIHRPAVVIGEDLDAAEAQLVDRAVGLRPAPRRCRSSAAQAHAPQNRSGCFATSSAISSFAIRAHSAASFGSSTLSRFGPAMVSSWTTSGYLSIDRNRTSRSVKPGVRVKVLAVLRGEPLRRPACSAPRDSAAAARGRRRRSSWRHLSPRDFVQSSDLLRCGRGRFRTRPLAPAAAGHRARRRHDSRRVGLRPGVGADRARAAHLGGARSPGACPAC